MVVTRPPHRSWVTTALRVRRHRRCESKVRRPSALSCAGPTKFWSSTMTQPVNVSAASINECCAENLYLSLDPENLTRAFGGREASRLPERMIAA